MADFDLTQSGQEIQDILDGAAMQTDLTAETERAEQAEQQLQNNIDLEETRAKAAEKQNADDIDVIEGKIPAAASSGNQLADKAFVNSSIATASATYRGAYNLVSDLHLTIDATEQQIAAALAGAISTADNNDYCFVQVPTSDATPTQIAAIERYKFNGTAWAYEYTLNNSGFTADQWAALNSGITTGQVAKLAALPTNDELTLLLGGKQNVLTFDNVPTEGSNNPVKSGGVKSAIDSEKERAQGAEQANAGNIAQVIAMIPAAASSENQLADKAFVNSSIATNTATYRGAYNEVSDLSLTVDATHEQIAAALAGAISTADNNDYCFVQIPTADATPTQIAAIERYKFNGTAWAYEYTLNNSGFTADQWAAINSGITSGLVAKLAALPTNDDLVVALAGKQPTLTFDNVPTENSTNPVKSGGVYETIAEEAGTRAAAIAAIVALIPSAASALNQLADKAFVNSAISTATAVFKGTFNVVADLELNYNASQAQIALMLGSKIASADNNDYCFVQIPTSNETPLEIARTDRYKYKGTAWAYEYTLNNSGFTAAQWAAINSGITSLLKDKLIDLPTATELATQLAAKQNALTFDSTPTEGSTNPVTSDGIHAAIDTEKARALAAEQGLLDEYNELYALYQTLQGGSIIPVAAADWPVSNPQQNVVYRVANSATPTAYSDYMYNGTNTILLAVFTFPGIDSMPTPGSTNLVESGGAANLSLQKALIGLHTTPASIYLSGENLVINIPNYVYIDNITFNVNKTFTITAPANGTLTRIFLKKDGSEVVVKGYDQNFFDADYALIGVLFILNSTIEKTQTIFYGRYKLNGDNQHIYCFGCLPDTYTKSESDNRYYTKAESRELFKYDTAIVGLHTTPAVIDISSNGDIHTVSFYIPNYVYTQRESFNVNKTFTTNVTKNGITRLFYNRTQDSISCLGFNDVYTPTTNEVYFLGTFYIDSDYNGLSLFQPIGRWSYKGKIISSSCPLGTIEEKLNLVPNPLTEENLYMFVYDKIYLIESEEYRLFKDSLFFSNVDGFSKNNSEIVVQTDSDVNMGQSVVSFNSDSIIGYASDAGIGNIVGIYINSNVNINGINKYGVRCSAYVAKNISGKSIRYTAIGDSQTDNGMFKAVRNYTNRKNFSVIGVGLLNDGVADTNNEGRSGWRYENIIGRSNAMGWGSIEVITPNGSVKNTTDFLHNNPFIRLATQSDKETYPTRCYTFTANQQTTANYLEKSYAEVQQEGGDLTQNFYIFDIANYFTVQHDWDGVGNPVDAISFAFSTNEFIIEGYNQTTINRLLDNVSWIIERCHEQLPNVKISFIACPAWAYNYNANYKNWVLPWFKSLCELIDTENVANTYIVQPHIFMDRGGYAYNRGSSHSDINNNTSMIQKYPGVDDIHFDSVGYQQYAKAVAGWLANLV